MYLLYVSKIILHVRVHVHVLYMYLHPEICTALINAPSPTYVFQTRIMHHQLHSLYSVSLIKFWNSTISLWLNKSFYTTINKCILYVHCTHLTVTVELVNQLCIFFDKFKLIHVHASPITKIKLINIALCFTCSCTCNFSYPVVYVFSFLLSLSFSSGW